jgi:hypothetical protein
MDHHDLIRRRDDLARDLHLRRELHDAPPSVGSAGLVVGAIMLLVLSIVFFGSSAADRTDLASGDSVETTAPQNNK